MKNIVKSITAIATVAVVAGLFLSTNAPKAEALTWYCRTGDGQQMYSCIATESEHVYGQGEYTANNIGAYVRSDLLNVTTGVRYYGASARINTWVSSPTQSWTNYNDSWENIFNAVGFQVPSEQFLY